MREDTQAVTFRKDDFSRFAQPVFSLSELFTCSLGRGILGRLVNTVWHTPRFNVNIHQLPDQLGTRAMLAGVVLQKEVAKSSTGVISKDVSPIFTDHQGTIRTRLVVGSSPAESRSGFAEA